MLIAKIKILKDGAKLGRSDKSKNISIAGLLSAVAVLLGYVEYLIPVVPPIAGIKLGLGNITVLLALRLLHSNKTAFFIMLIKCTVCAALFSGMGSLPYSLAGGVLSVVVMSALCRVNDLSSAGISSAGGVAHMVAQTAVAALVTSTVGVITLLPILMAVGTFTGLINGIIVNLVQNLRFDIDN